MSDPIQHECGIAFVRLLKPLEYYKEKYGSYFWGLNKMYLLMEKQHNRGQDGVGLASIKMDMAPGKRCIYRERSVDANPIKNVFANIFKQIEAVNSEAGENTGDARWMKENVPFLGEAYLGHLRYGTYGKNEISACHPFVRQSNWLTRNLVLAGNFNLTNVDSLFNTLIGIGQHPIEKSDTVTMLEKVGHYLDVENDRLYKKLRKEEVSKSEVSKRIGRELDIKRILTDACEKWDGGFAIAGMLGHGDAFVLRDPWGIRPAFVYQDDEVVVIASERPVIQTAFDVPFAEIKEITPGSAVVVKKDGAVEEIQYREQEEIKQCSFERIYFSRGSDAEIYRERKKLGRLLVPAVLREVNGELNNTVFSFIPNTAEVSYYGMMKQLDQHARELMLAEFKKFKPEDLTEEKIKEVLKFRARREKVALKDAKMRTFITSDSDRDELAAHVYDITYNSVRKGEDNLVVIDDSIVRGTTLKQSILKILDRLAPKKIVVVSSAPQIRFPDCYGIDMAKLADFCAFRAAIELLKDNGMTHVIDEAYQKCLAQTELDDSEVVNYVKDIYAHFTPEQVAHKIGEILKPEGMKTEVSIIFQSIENLHVACPNHKGDWYFSGDYPTPGGNRVVNRAFINYVEGRDERAY